MVITLFWADVTKHSKALLLLQVHELWKKIVPRYLVVPPGFNFTRDLYLLLEKVQHVDTVPITYLKFNIILCTFRLIL